MSGLDRGIGEVGIGVIIYVDNWGEVSKAGRQKAVRTIMIIVKLGTFSNILCKP
jgi:hypothetical protein